MVAKTFLKTTLAILGLLVVLGASTTAGGQIIYVDDDGPADFSNIQAAIDDSNDGDIIIVNPGTYTGDGNRDIDFKGKAITVRGTDPSKLNIISATIIDCEGSDEDNHRGFYFHSGEDETSILEGLTITNGFHGDGAGICCRDSSPTIRNNIITGNETVYDSDGGAGIACWKGASPTIANNIISDNICAPGGGGGGIRCFDWCSPTITNCTFSRNWSGGILINNSNPTISNCTFEGNFGGGVSSSSLSSPIFINCTFIGNSSPDGGGVHIYESNPILINCSFIQNVATSRGGGIWIYGWDTASPTLINCTFAGNSAGSYGGGMYSRDNTNSMLVNCTFTGNSADDAGGAVYNYGYNRSVRITLNNCTFSGNSAANGNDLACDSPYGPPSVVQVTNCIIWDGENAILNNDGSTITITYSDVYGGWPGQGNIDADPCFVDPDGYDSIFGTEDDNLSLLRNSPCIDAGDPNYIAGPNETDLDGKPRVIGGRIDMGAYEFQSQLILYVDDDAAGANDGSSWADAYNYLQDALAAAYDGDEIRVAQGTYKPDQGAGITPGDREATFQLINGVTIKGGYAGAGTPHPNDHDIELYKTILTGAGNSYHVVTGSRTDETAVLDGFTVTGGNANAKWPEKDDSGSGMFNHNGSPRLANCTFKGNKAYYGAGIYNVSSIRPPMLTNCIISDNWAYNYGGGIYNKNCSPILTNCTFSDNKASDGAGMYNMSNRSMLRNCAFINNWASEGGGMCNRHDGNPTLTNCTFSGNSANFYGGGMANRHSSPTMTNCIFSENSADAGGGIRNLDSNPTLRNCIFSGNSAYEGGGMFCAFSSPTLINCTLSGNSASDYGGGIYGEHSSNPTLTNCTLWGNSDSEIESSAVITYSDIKGGWPGIGNIDTDPLFIDPGYWDANGVWTDGDYRLLPDSPCIDAGDPNYIAGPDETDLDGNPRVMGGRIDIGAYEYQCTISAEARILPQTINLASKGNWITCYIWLPDEYDIADIEPNSVFLEDDIQPEQFSVDQQQQLATARFSRVDVLPVLEVGEINLKITGQLTDGTVFEATDTIKVIDKSAKN